MKFIAPKDENIKISRECDISWVYIGKRGEFLKFIYLERLKKALFLAIERRYKRILDVGTGYGILLPTLSKYSDKVFAIDTHKIFKNLKYFCAKEGLKNVIFIRCDANNLPFKENAFDFVFCLSVLEHIKDPGYIICNLKKVLKRNGKLIIGYPIERMITKLGFKITKMENSVKREHISSFEKIRDCILKKLKVEKKVNFPFNHAPDALTLYEIVRCSKY
jgi:2-polyprenyl-3-methyl-5-hydroxy-6-metoxy-1,4-benzoquinol methylase